MTATVPSLVDQLLREQQSLTAVEAFARRHAQSDAVEAHSGRYESLIPLSSPLASERYAFEVNLDACTGCKACVTACHNLNGLDDGETWRRVGLLVDDAPAAPERQLVTAACHHCEDPACQQGCPVQAYDQDATTGIVRHLDDQCIGCQYCVLMCPYEVPQYSGSRGIVRKCDMCHGRLAEGEAPACVQGCPNDAIAIRLVPRGGVGFALPGGPDPSITRPSTRYRGVRRAVAGMRAADGDAVRPAHSHWPLVIMLALTQTAVGMLGASVLLGDLLHVLVPGEGMPVAGAAWVTLALGLVASVMHLGQPLKAWRVFLGVRTSWLSREVLVFGALFAAASLYVGEDYLGSRVSGVAGTLAVELGLVGVACSVLVYHVTRRAIWSWQRTGLLFASATCAAGAATALVALAYAGFPPYSLIAVALVTAMASLLGPALFGIDLVEQARDDATMRRVVRVLTGPLRRWTAGRVGLAAAAAVAFPAVGLLAGAPLLGAIAAWTAVAAGTMVERYLFFTAALAPRMPGEG